MVAAVEIMRRTPQISKLILDGEFQAMHEAIESSRCLSSRCRR